MSWWLLLASGALVGGCSSDSGGGDPGSDAGPGAEADGEGEGEPSPAGEGEGAPTPAEPGEGEGEGEGQPAEGGEGEGEGEGPPPDDGTCPRPEAPGEPDWCLDLTARFNTSELRDLDGDGEDDFFGVREYLIDRSILVGQDPGSPVSMAREGFPFQCQYGLLVPHGGAIEGGTEQLARAILQRIAEPTSDSVGAWIVGGRNSTRNLCSSCDDAAPCPMDCHHVTSVAIDPDCPPKPGDDPDDRGRARLPRILDLCPTGLALHGHAGPELGGREKIIVGGRDAVARAELVDLLRREIAAGHFRSRLVVVDAQDPEADDLGGLHRCSITNRWTPDRDAAGIQLELPPSLRPGALRLDSVAAADKEHPLYMHRHEAQTVLGDPSVLSEILAVFITEQLAAD